MNSWIGTERLHRLTRAGLFAVVLLVLVLPAAYGAGTQIWLKRYNGPGNDVDEASAVTVDAAGNVYVTGRSTGYASDADYFTIKYGPGGWKKWTARYDGPAGKWDGARAIAVDANGNVYVTGRSFGVGSHADFATIKYDRDGKQQWVRRYSGPGYADDGAMGIAVDSAGNVYVTGFSTGSGTLYDFVTIKYGPGGWPQWTRRYDGPAGAGDIAQAIGVDGSGNVYVTGPSKGEGTNFDYATVKYNTDGVVQWVRRYNGSSNGNDGSTAIAVSDYGYVWVTGYSYRPQTSADYVTIRYGPGGWAQWTERYDGPAHSGDVPWGVATMNGYAYVTGSSAGVGSDTDYATIKYGRSGEQMRVRRYNGPGNGADVANAIAASGWRVYVTGYSRGAGTDGDYATIAYGGGLWPKWLRRYNGAASEFDQANAVAIAPSGEVVVTGGSTGVSSKSDYTTIKYAP